MNNIGPDEVKRRFEKVWQSPSGILGWIATVNSRPLGQRYMITALIFFSVGILLALMIRSQLAFPDNDLLKPDTYNGIFTMHGSTMLYLFAVPFIEALGIYFIPLLIGSRDLAFPRLTNLGYWLYLFGGLIMYASVFLGVVPDAGWTAYPPLSGSKYSGIGLDFWLLGLSMLEIAGIGAALEIVVTIMKLRAPGMAIQHIPVIVWTYLVTGVMILFAFTPLLIATLMLEMDRTFGTHFFNPEQGGSSLLWQHLFWWFGHPEVYIIFLPATGVISAIIPVFTKRRLVGYSLVVAAVIVVGFVSFGLWTHHMFTSGIPTLPMHFFTAASYMIALASGVQVFAWIATIWGSRIQYSVQILFILSFFIIFVNGGITGVMVATMPFDWQVHDTNFVVAHFHHVLIGGAVLPLLAGLYHWFPKISGRMFSEKWGRISIGTIFLGFNLAFIPLYIAGILGMRRRIYTYPEEMGVGTLNMISTIGAFVLVTGFAIALFNLVWNSFVGRKAGNDPWNAGTLEWSVSSPPAPHGFDRPPVVRDRYPQWQKSSLEVKTDTYTEKLHNIAKSLENRPCNWRATMLTDVTNAHPQTVQWLPGPTLNPFYLALAMLLALIFVLAKSYITASVAVIIAAILTGRWAYSEPVLPDDEYRLLTANFDLPLRGNGTQSLEWWGMVGLIATLFTVLATFIFSYFYLRLYSPQWPQNGIPLPSLIFPSIAFSILFAGGLLQILNRWARGKNYHTVLLTVICAQITSGIGFLLIELYDMVKTPFLINKNAYSSIYFTMLSFVILLVFTGITMHIVTLVRLIKKNEPLQTPVLKLWFQNSELFWSFTVAASAIVFITVFLVPYLS